MKRNLACLTTLLPAIAMLLLLIASSEEVAAQSGWPALDSNCNDGECVFGVLASADDAGPTPDYDFQTNWPEIYLGRRSDGTSIVSGFRFANVTLTPGTVITQAYLVFRVDGNYTTPITMTLFGENVTNTVSFSSSSQPVDRPRLSGVSTTWSIPASDLWIQDHIRQSPNITAIIQTIVNKPGWQSGNALAILTEPASSTASGAYRRVFAYDRYSSSAYSARLVIRLLPHKAYLPAVISNYPPPESPSYYVTDINTLDDLGGQLGQQDRDTPGAQQGGPHCQDTKSA